jgi:predicted Fe-S protein YdhL (DUF1289 family)
MCNSRIGKAVPESIESPCILICTVDPQAGLCTGCGRTLDEIAGWSAMTPATRRRIMDELPERRAAAKGADGS